MDPNNLFNVNANVTQHYLYLHTDPNFSKVTPIQIAAGTPAGATGSYAVTLQTDKTYYWRVDESINQSGLTDANTIIGPMWKFETVKSVPAITDEPISVLLDQVGQAAVFSLEADSLSVPKYYWYKSADNVNNTPDNDTSIGSNSNVLTFSTTQFADEGFYFCKVVNDSGEANAAYSAVAKLGFKQFMAHWTMDQTRFVGNQYLDEKNNHPADPNNPAAVTFIEGIGGTENGAVVIDAANSWANAGVWTPDAYTDQITLSAWVKWNGSVLIGDGPGIISKRKADGGNWWSLYTRNGDAGHIGNVWIRFSSFNGGDVWAGPNALVANEWTHVVAIVDGAKAGHVFINGLKKATDTTWSFGTAANMDAPVMIGAALADGTNPFLGALDEIQIYNYALTDLDIAKMYTTLSGDKVCLPSQRPNAKYDLNGDCIVDMMDFAQFALSWLECGLVPDCIK